MIRTLVRIAVVMVLLTGCVVGSSGDDEQPPLPTVEGRSTETARALPDALESMGASIEKPSGDLSDWELRSLGDCTYVPDDATLDEAVNSTFSLVRQFFYDCGKRRGPLEQKVSERISGDARKLREMGWAGKIEVASGAAMKVSRVDDSLVVETVVRRAILEDRYWVAFKAEWKIENGKYFLSIFELGSAREDDKVLTGDGWVFVKL